MKKLLKRFAKEESGQGMTEYIIIAVVIVVAAIAIFSTFGKTIISKMKDANNSIKSDVKSK